MELRRAGPRTGNKTVSSFPAPGISQFGSPSSALRRNRTKCGKMCPSQSDTYEARASSSTNFDQKCRCDWGVRNQFVRKFVWAYFVTVMCFCRLPKPQEEGMRFLHVTLQGFLAVRCEQIAFIVRDQTAKISCALISIINRQASIPLCRFGGSLSYSAYHDSQLTVLQLLIIINSGTGGSGHEGRRKTDQ